MNEREGIQTAEIDGDAYVGLVDDRLAAMLGDRSRTRQQVRRRRIGQLKIESMRRE